MSGFFITGTDTDVGKSVASAWACLQLDGAYWKPVQAGLSDGLSDTDVVQTLTNFGPERFFKSCYDLTQPLSPHEAARLDGVEIELADFELPPSNRPLIVEGAGGALVPLNSQDKMIDLMKLFELPIIVVARSRLGTINHSLLTLEALRARGLAVAGVIVSGPLNEANNRAIEAFGNVHLLAILPQFLSLNTAALLNTKPLIDPLEWMSF